ncbi:GPW/gp25 family protein [Magnetofaba australis]|uniref:Putative baseplate assembly protein W n=1 Tax=Magnetofaba australis IT-1 TaxID=1434232 RepID=A0A1Y2K0T7_9PROT|nr:GPW/gp25 family protein [Magnetofaba australis]OSM01660.1 putative baseplate assembly protein W [Magnetofaba australis IT-1]
MSITPHGMDSTTGVGLEAMASLRQSVRDILTTPLGTRVMRRDYGSRLFELVDAPLNQGTLLAIYAATAEALDRWEPRLRLTRTQARSAGPGRISLDIEAVYLPDGAPIQLEGVEI